jgi:hypothetical protein
LYFFHKFNYYNKANALFLSVSAQFNVEIAEQILDWLTHKLNIISGLNDEGYSHYTIHCLSENQDKNEIIQLIKKLDLGIVLNTGIPRKDYCDKLTNLLGYKYEKNSEMMYEILISEGKQAIAIKNAENLLKQYQPNNPEKDNPSTTVHLLVQELNKFIQ